MNNWTVKTLATAIAVAMMLPAASFAENIEYSVAEQRLVKVDVGVALIDSVRSALLASYSVNNAWPATMSKLVVDGYVSSVNAPWGSTIGGVVSGGGRSFTLTLAAPDPITAQSIASKLGAVAAGSTVQVVVPVPAAASVADSMLSRVAVPGMPDRNKMFTDIDINGFALKNVGAADFVTINSQAGTVGSLTVETAMDVKPDATFRRNVAVGGNADIAGTVKSARVESNSLKINGGAELNGPVNVGGDISGTNLVAARDVVAGQTVRGASGQFNSVVVNGAITAESANLNSATAKTLTVTNMFKSLGPSEFVQDALFRGAVVINGSLTVGGIASALDIREGGVLLKDKYLGINAKAADAYKADRATNADNADKLGGLDSSAYAQRAANNTFSGVNTFTQAIRADGGVIVDNKTVISADGKTLYEDGVALSSKYLGKNDTAQNSLKLGNVAASNYARTDVDETFAKSVTFNGRAYAKNGLHVQGDWLRVDGANGIYFQSYGGGWHMTDSSTIRAYGGKSIFTSGAMYEYGTALNQRYLGKTDKAVSAQRADVATNAEKLGNVAAANYARKDVANTFTALQTFNGGIKASGTSTFSAITASGNIAGNDLLFKDSTGVQRSMRATYTDVKSLQSWKTACQRSVKDPNCGLSFEDVGGGGSGGQVVWSGKAKSVRNSWGEGTYSLIISGDHIGLNGIQSGTFSVMISTLSGGESIVLSGGVRYQDGWDQHWYDGVETLKVSYSNVTFTAPYYYRFPAGGGPGSGYLHDWDILKIVKI